MAENHHIFTTPSPLSQTTLIASMPVEAPSYKAADKSTSADPTDDEPCNFNKLPPELRTEIWKLAASSDNNVLMISDRKEATVTIPPPRFGLGLPRITGDCLPVRPCVPRRGQMDLVFAGVRPRCTGCGVDFPTLAPWGPKGAESHRGISGQ
ncbi:hypothetical protein PG988_006333 [Apiospora saccharicola]